MEQCKVDMKMSRRGYKCKPTKGKVTKWLKTIEGALVEKRLTPGDASKLAGRLSWGSSHLFRPARSVSYFAHVCCTYVYMRPGS